MLASAGAILTLGAYFAPKDRDLKHAPATKALIEVQTDARHQSIEGFGTCLVSWRPEFATYYQSDAFTNLYLRDLGASALRVDLWEASVPERSAAEDIDYRDFLLDGVGERGRVFLETAARLTRASGGKLRVIASVWSPPAWMKESGLRGSGSGKDWSGALSLEELRENRRESNGEEATLGDRQRFLHENRLRPDRYEHFAHALVEWVRLYRSRGVELYGLSLQNEPRFSHWFESCTYLPSELAELAEVVVTTFERERERLPRLFLPETMTHDVAGNTEYLAALLAKPEVAERLHALASHGYVDGYKADARSDSPGRFRRLAELSGKAVWMTEGGTGEHAWPAPIHELGAGLHNGLQGGGASLITPWLVVGTKADTHSLATLDGRTKKTSVAAHFFRYITPGSVRVETVTRTGGIATTAFLDEAEKELVLIALNRGRHAETASFRVADRTQTPVWGISTTERDDLRELRRDELEAPTLPPESITTFRFRLNGGP